MAWKVGVGSQVRIGSNVILRCNQHIFISIDIIDILQLAGIYTLNNIGKEEDTFILRKGWLSTQDVNLDGLHAQ